MDKTRKTDDKSDPLLSLYKILCNAVFDDEYGANETTYNALMILGEAIDRKAAKEIAQKISKADERYRYLE